ncbi:MAG TPA: hypothetical protein VFL64_17110 [Rhizobacter sp.]|nr:hypothetical protein [Rhizobacter sp.]
MLETVFAVLTLVICIALMVRLLVGPRRRQGLDAWARRTGLGIKYTALRVYHWRSSRQTAKRVAEDAIRRARDDKGSWEGNVYKPKSFKRPPRDKMH